MASRLNRTDNMTIRRALRGEITRVEHEIEQCAPFKSDKAVMLILKALEDELKLLQLVHLKMRDKV